MEWNLKKNRKLALALLLLLGGGTVSTSLALPFLLSGSKAEAKEFHFIGGLKDEDGKVMLFESQEALKAHITDGWTDNSYIVKGDFTIPGVNEVFATEVAAKQYLYDDAKVETISLVAENPTFDSKGMLTSTWSISTGSQTIFKGGNNIYTNVEADAYTSLIDSEESVFFSGITGSTAEYTTQADAEAAVYTENIAEQIAVNPSSVTPMVGATYTTDAGESVKNLAAGTWDTEAAEEVTTFNVGDTVMRVNGDTNFEGELSYQDVSTGYIHAPHAKNDFGSYASAISLGGMMLAYGDGGVTSWEGMASVMHVDKTDPAAPKILIGKSAITWEDFKLDTDQEIVPVSLDKSTWPDGLKPAGNMWQTFASGNSSGDMPSDMRYKSPVNIWYYMSTHETVAGQVVWDYMYEKEGAVDGDFKNDGSNANLDDVLVPFPAGWVGLASDADKIVQVTDAEFGGANTVYKNLGLDSSITSTYITDDQVTTMDNVAGWYLPAAEANMDVSDTTASIVDLSSITEFYPADGNTATDGSGELVSDIAKSHGYKAHGWTNKQTPDVLYSTEQDAKDATDVTTVFEKIRITGGYTGANVVDGDSSDAAKELFIADFDLISKSIDAKLPETGSDYDSTPALVGVADYVQLDGVSDKAFKDEASARVHYRDENESTIVGTPAYAADETVFPGFATNIDLEALIAEIVATATTVSENDVDSTTQVPVVAKSVVLTTNELY